VKFIEPLTAAVSAGKRPELYYQYTAIDDCTRIRVLRIYDRNIRRPGASATPASSPMACQ
jgi:hypothetical protein